jgi:hypothetical protein
VLLLPDVATPLRLAVADQPGGFCVWARAGVATAASTATLHAPAARQRRLFVIGASKIRLFPSRASIVRCRREPGV